MKYLTLYKNNRQYITSSLTRKHPNVSFLTEENIVKYQEEPDKLDQEILDSLVAVVICDGKANNDSDRDTVKNLVDPDNPFVISNAAYTEGSGYADKDSPYYGAFVTDGIDDLITSTKTMQEMLGGSNEITVVSMIHLVQTPAVSSEKAYTNQIRTGQNYLRNYVTNNGKTGIYGYTYKGNNVSVINNILGDKNDYTVENKSWNNLAKFSVIGYEDNGTINELDQVAWYWTIIAKKVLTTDQINQIIKYYNLDKYIVPDVYYNVKKQGITNENHSEFNDKLIDYSGNNKDLQLYNFSWDNGSGIGKFNTNFQNGNIWTHFVHIDNVTSDSFTYSRNESSWVVFSNTELTNIDVPSFKIKISGLLDGQTINYSHYTSLGVSEDYIMSSDGEYTLPSDIRTAKPSVSNTSGFRVNNKETDNEIIITILPEEPYALVLDGVDDYGKAIELPIYKDYTFIIDRQIISIGETAGIVASKSESSTDTAKQGAFLFEYLGSPNYISSWSFYKDNGKVANTDFTRSISYQSKYNYNGVELSSGTSLDSDKLWLGIVRDNDSRFANIAVYSLMSFPYSMSEFLIERQLKMYNLGTLYPGMVEFRPIVKSNVKWNIIEIWQGGKSLYRPAVNDNKTGIYLKKDSTIGIYVKPKDADEVTKIVVNGTEYTNLKINSNGFYYVTLPITKSPQKINITIDEYIRYEDIVQPYPVVFQIKDRTTNQIYSWGDKIKVGSSIQLFHDESPNLLSGLYRIDSYEYEGKTYTYNQLNNLDITLTKSSISISCNKTWILDDNEPKCILSPERLRIPNSSYSILGYIPDISGHGNNFTFNNFLFSGMSGANGYQLDFKTFTTGNTSLVNIKNDSMIEVTNVNNKNGVTWINLNKLTSINLNSWTIKVTGMKSGDVLGYYYSGSEDATTRSKFDIREDGTYSLPKSIANSNNIGGIAFDVVVVANSTYRIEQIGEYEGSICFDGVDDFILNNGVRGGKQIIMKCNWWSTVGTSILYDQRGNGNEFAIFNADSEGSLDDTFIAYSGRSNGNTYIDGILNSNIHCRDLIGITHNITHTNELNAGPNSATVRLGCNNAVQYFSQMALYDLMIFNEISTDDKIKELNEYVGIEAKVELPPYYWDAYGKTNLDEDNTTIQQRGVAVGDYDLTNYNHAYEGMSGYNGYPVVFGANKTWANESNGYVTSITSNTIHITNVLNAGLALLYSYVKYNGNLQNIKEIPPFKIEIKGLEGRSKFIYKYLATSDATKETNLYLGNGTHELPKSFLPTEALINNAVVGFSISPIEEGVTNFLSDITIEVLPKYKNGLIYDGVEDFSDNKNVPIIDDFTVIAKRTWLEENTSDKPFIIKGDTLYSDGNKNAFLFEYGKLSTYSFGQNNKYDESVVPSLISWATPTSYNGTTSLVRGSAIDTVGIDIAHATKIVLYKLILYPKTIPLLQINFLKNLMEKDEIIDLNNSIFIK